MQRLVSRDNRPVTLCKNGQNQPLPGPVVGFSTQDTERGARDVSYPKYQRGILCTSRTIQKKFPRPAPGRKLVDIIFFGRGELLEGRREKCQKCETKREKVKKTEKCDVKWVK